MFFLISYHLTLSYLILILNLPCYFTLTSFSLLSYLSFFYYLSFFLLFLSLSLQSLIYYSLIIDSSLLFFLLFSSFFTIIALSHLFPFPYRYCHCVLTQSTFCSVLRWKEVQGRSTSTSNGSVSYPSVPSLQPNPRRTRSVDSYNRFFFFLFLFLSLFFGLSKFNTSVRAYLYMYICVRMYVCACMLVNLVQIDLHHPIVKFSIIFLLRTL